ncbi:MAG: hypothetical protein GF383_13210 [Candidatus Lokiarchaeota archaeon]|nr:hypothetical protein [Candidatus Lokiarchaeota archaeon]MBD3342122.1 hypothetical protein [Candidatus Lokiarchaeota archaeon]
MIGQNSISLLNDFLQSIGRYYAIVIYSLITIILTIRLIKDKKESGNINLIRLLILGVFGCVYWINILEFLAFETPILPVDAIGFQINDFSLYNFGLGLAVTLGIVLAAYINQLKPFYFTALYFYFGLLVLYFYAGTSLILLPYIYITGITALTLQMYTGLKLKDNGALGVAVFFAIAFVTILLPEEGVIGVLDALATLIYATFGLIFALGYFKPFKEPGGK